MLAPPRWSAAWCAPVRSSVKRCALRERPTVPSSRIPPEFERRRLIVDKRRLERVFANLIENANRYAGGVTRVWWSSGSETQIRFVIEDARSGCSVQRAQAHLPTIRARCTGRGQSRSWGWHWPWARAHHRARAPTATGAVWVEDNAGRWRALCRATTAFRGIGT